MQELLADNWIPVLLIGGMLVMHLFGHRGHRGHGGGCGGGHGKTNHDHAGNAAERDEAHSTSRQHGQ